jgi:hypothetical protein
MNVFQADPQFGADRPPIGIDPQIAAADEVDAPVIEVVVRPIVDRHALGRQAVPGVRVPREERRDAGERVMAEVVAADLPVIVRQAFGVGLRLREQQQPRVLVRIAR